MLIQPDGVAGLITYQPQTFEEQPERKMNAKHKR